MPTKPRAEPLSEDELVDFLADTFWEEHPGLNKAVEIIHRLRQENEVMAGLSLKLKADNEALRRLAKAAIYQMRTCASCCRSSALESLEAKP